MLSSPRDVVGAGQRDGHLHRQETVDSIGSDDQLLGPRSPLRTTQQGRCDVTDNVAGEPRRSVALPSGLITRP
jgi:hypothetical protein